MASNASVATKAIFDFRPDGHNAKICLLGGTPQTRPWGQLVPKWDRLFIKRHNVGWQPIQNDWLLPFAHRF